MTKSVLSTISTTDLMPKVLRRPPLNAVVPIFSLVRRLIRGRWWDDVTRQPRKKLRDIRKVGTRQTFSDGVGDIVNRKYEISLASSTWQPDRILAEFKQNPNRFCPVNYAAFDTWPLTLGTHSTVKLAGPWSGPIEVIVDEPRRLKLATLDGHMEAGWIEFRATGDSHPLFTIESSARAGDLAFWFVHDFFPLGRWIQTDMWCTVAESAARLAGVRRPESVQVSTINHDYES